MVRFGKLPVWVFAWITCLCPLTLRSQSDGPSGTSRPSADTAGTSRAREILAAAVKVQSSAEKAPKITSFQGACQFKVFEYDAKTGARKQNAGDIRQFWARDETPEARVAYRRFMSTDVAGGGTLIVDYDDIVWRPHEKTGKPEFLSTKAYEPDRKRLRAERRRFTRLLQLYFLANLNHSAPELKVDAEDAEISFQIAYQKFKHRTHVLSTVDDEGNPLMLWFDTKTHHMVKARITDRKQPEEVDEFHFAYHDSGEIHDTKDKVTIPRWVQYLENGRVTLEITAAAATEFKFNSLTKDERRNLFVAPEN